MLRYSLYESIILCLTVCIMIINYVKNAYFGNYLIVYEVLNNMFYFSNNKNVK